MPPMFFMAFNEPFRFTTQISSILFHIFIFPTCFLSLNPNFHGFLSVYFVFYCSNRFPTLPGNIFKFIILPGVVWGLPA